MTSHSWKFIVSRLIKGGLLVGLIAALIWSLAPHDPGTLTAQLQSAAADERSLDPDRPGFIAGLIDEQTYLQLRNDYIAERRGLPYGNTGSSARTGAARHDASASAAGAPENGPPSVSGTRSGLRRSPTGRPPIDRIR